MAEKRGSGSLETTYVLPMNTNDEYNDKFLQVAEPPPKPKGTNYIKAGNAKIAEPKADYGNLEFIGIMEEQKPVRKQQTSTTSSTNSLEHKDC